MKVTKAVITAAGPGQRTLPVQVLIDRDGVEKPLLRILVEEAVSAGIEEIAVVVAPGDEKPYVEAIGDADGVAGALEGIPGRAELTFIPQERPLGYGHAVYCARDFVGGEPFLHLVGDHLYVSDGDTSCARQLVETASAQDCAVSAVQATRESLLPYFGAIGGRRVQGRRDLYVVETVVEKPAPTEAELRLTVPGLRAGHYLCFFGMHVLTPTIMDILAEQVAATSEATSHEAPTRRAPLSAALATLAARERYLALEERAWRYDVGVRYGILNAQLALALSGKDRAEVLSLILDLLAQRDLGAIRR
jgi:UTP--glucose-1-phosphate uridylyltransferase